MKSVSRWLPAYARFNKTALALGLQLKLLQLDDYDAVRAAASARTLLLKGGKADLSFGFSDTTLQPSVSCSRCLTSACAPAQGQG